MIHLADESPKTCTGCGETKPKSAFPTYLGRGKRYAHSRCVPCRREFDRDRRRAEYEQLKPYKILWQYGITIEQRDAMLIEQGGCGICHRPDPGPRDWHVDHDHSCCPGGSSCGKCVRGILCNNCNIGIGLLGDDAERVASAARYLARTQIH